MCAGHALRAGLGESRAVWPSKRAASNNAMRAMHGRPGGYEHKTASAALQTRMNGHRKENAIVNARQCRILPVPFPWHGRSDAALRME